MLMFTKMGIPGGVKRYMDDFIVALLCRNPEEVTAATAFVTELNKPTVLPPPTLPQHGTPGQPRVPRMQCGDQW